MSTRLPVLETERLIIRPFIMDDLHAIHQVFVDANWVNAELTFDEALAQRRVWLEWATRNPDALAGLNQPPYGDRAVVLKETGALAGAAGLVPCLNQFGQIDYFQAQGYVPGASYPEVGLFWAFARRHRSQGYGTEAARALIDHMFGAFKLRRIIAETDYDNESSMAIMRRLGMTLYRNPLPEPAWLQVVAVLENPAFAAAKESITKEITRD